MSDRLLKESDVLKIAFQLPLVVNSAFADAVKALPSADRPSVEDCEFCQNHEQGDTLYEPSDWDGGIGFDYIRDIKYCPLCGGLLDGEEQTEREDE